MNKLKLTTIVVMVKKLFGREVLDEENNRRLPETPPEFPETFYAEMDSKWSYDAKDILYYKLYGDVDINGFIVKYPKHKKLAIYKLEKVIEVSYPPYVIGFEPASSKLEN